MADQGGSAEIREYRKGNWTVSETMVLIEAKRMDDERRMKRIGDTEARNKPAELRWKWVEDYCWRKGCSRSQNQCNDKWDNLMRDYKKVREYERRLAEKGEGDHEGSYWRMEKNERKEKNLPSNMLPQIYDALVEVVERKGGQRAVSGGSGSNPTVGYAMERHMISGSVQPSLPPLLQHQISTPIPAALPLPPPPLPLLQSQTAPAAPPAPQAQPTPPPQPMATVAQILIQVSIQTHQRREGEGEATEKGPGRQVREQAALMKWALPSPKVLPL